MATTAGDEPSVSTEDTLKRQKKQARREAKLMLAIEAAKKDLKKAQKKQSKVQARLEERSTTLHILEARLEELRAQGPQAATDAEPTSLQSEEATLPGDMVVIQDMTAGEAMQEKEILVESASVPTTPVKTSGSKTAAARTSTGSQTTSTP